jgi:dihydroorotate dehydrogenase
MLDLAYRLARPLLFALDAETAHESVLRLAPLVPWFAGDRKPDPRLARDVGGVRWTGAVGLAAGLDKDGRAIGAWDALGFGAIEVGTVTAHAQPGNPGPRLYRLVPERGLVNRMGFNNHGAAALAERLRALRERGSWPSAPVGVNVGKTKVVPAEDAVGDYLASVRALHGLPDYLVVNVSSPNTPGLRDLQEREPLARLLGAVVPAASPTPVYVKLAPDLESDALSQAVDVAVAAGCRAIVATNTTLSRPGTTGRLDQAGGLSGAPLRELARAKVAVTVAAASGRVPVVGVGGVGCADDARALLELGCAAVQLYSALIFEGPGVVARIHGGLGGAAGRT